MLTGSQTIHVSYLLINTTRRTEMRAHIACTRTPACGLATTQCTMHMLALKPMGLRDTHSSHLLPRLGMIRRHSHADFTPGLLRHTHIHRCLSVASTAAPAKLVKLRRGIRYPYCHDLRLDTDTQQTSGGWYNHRRTCERNGHTANNNKRREGFMIMCKSRVLPHAHV